MILRSIFLSMFLAVLLTVAFSGTVLAQNEDASKLNTYMLLNQSGLRASKLNTYMLLNQTLLRASKLNTYLVLQTKLPTVQIMGAAQDGHRGYRRRAAVARRHTYARLLRRRQLLFEASFSTSPTPSVLARATSALRPQ
jgi:hypothetical protein